YPMQAAMASMKCNLDASRARYLNSYWNREDVGVNRLKRHREDVIALYDSGIRWVDTQIASLFDAFRQLHLLETCLVAVTADHGEEFLVLGSRYHAPSKVTEELVRVPLLVHSPAQQKPASFDTPFSLIHLAPTLLEAVHAPVPANFTGQSQWAR